MLPAKDQLTSWSADQTLRFSLHDAEPLGETATSNQRKLQLPLFSQVTYPEIFVLVGLGSCLATVHFLGGLKSNPNDELLLCNHSKTTTA